MTTPFPPFELERFFARYEFRTPFLLSSSDCETVTVGDLLALEPDAAERFHTLALGYTESAGSPALRQEISRIYSSVTPDETLVCSGAEEGIFLFMHAALKPSDHVIVQTPCYQSLCTLPGGIGCEVAEWRGRDENGWHWDMDDLRRLVRPQTRALILNAPHNPTGALFPRADFDAICDLAARHGILLFGDEVYRELEYDPATRLPAVCDRSESAVSLGVLSKTYGLPGLRIGWVTTRNKALRERMAQIKDYTTICNSAPSEFLAEIALRHREQLAARNLAIIARNLPLLDAFFARHEARFAWRKPAAGSIAFPRFRAGGVRAFCEDAAERVGVLLLPGDVYDAPDYFRVGFGRRNMPEAVARLEAFLMGG